ncbi:MAG: HAD-IIIA family hydrolase [Anaerolineae bacterium]
MGQRGIFLDRDGTLNHLVYYADTDEWESPRTSDTLRLIDGVDVALRRLIEAGWFLFLVSNQPSYAKGKTSLENLQAVHNALDAQLLHSGVHLSAAYYCYHHPRGIVPAYTTNCECRKPGTKSLREAAASFDLELNNCWMIGDQDSDVQCGQNAGCRTILLEYSHSASKRGNSRPDHGVIRLIDAVDWILRQDQK